MDLKIIVYIHGALKLIFCCISDEVFPQIMDQLAPICKEYAITGTPKQAKGAIHCIYKNMPNLHDTLFPSILDSIKNNLNAESPHYRTAIVTLGHIAFNVPERYKVQIKNIVSRKVSKNLQMEYVSIWNKRSIIFD